MSSSPKSPAPVRRVWRMSAESPAGEYVDVDLGADEPERIVLPTFPRRRRSDHALPESPLPENVATPRRRTEDRYPSSARVLNPAQVENWQSSSFDLLSGCGVRDVTDTIPGNVFDELFGPSAADPH